MKIVFPSDSCLSVWSLSEMWKRIYWLDHYQNLFESSCAIFARCGLNSCCSCPQRMILATHFDFCFGLTWCARTVCLVKPLNRYLHCPCKYCADLWGVARNFGLLYLQAVILTEKEIQLWVGSAYLKILFVLFQKCAWCLWNCFGLCLVLTRMASSKSHRN